MNAATVRSKGRLTIPNDVRQQAHIDEGTVVEFVVTREGVLLKPKLTIDADQAWFWTPEWQQMEREAEADLEAGGGKAYKSEDELQRALDAARNS